MKNFCILILIAQVMLGWASLLHFHSFEPNCLNINKVISTAEEDCKDLVEFMESTKQHQLLLKEAYKCLEETCSTKGKFLSEKTLHMGPTLRAKIVKIEKETTNLTAKTSVHQKLARITREVLDRIIQFSKELTKSSMQMKSECSKIQSFIQGKIDEYNLGIQKLIEMKSSLHSKIVQLRDFEASCPKEL